MAHILVDPPCKNHPDRKAIAHYGNPYSYSLCGACVDDRLASFRRMNMDEHGRRMHDNDSSHKE